MWKNLRDAPDRALSLARYRRLAAGYDDTCRYIGAARVAALEALGDVDGRTIFDVACGTGAMLPALARRAGPNGTVVGIEHSAEMARIARARLGNLPGRVSVMESSVEEARPSRAADALLFCYTHDVLQSPAALENVFRHARPGARVVVLGTRFQSWWWAAPINLWMILRGWRYHTTFRGFSRPWGALLPYCPDLRVQRSFHLGMSYLAAGHFCVAPEECLESTIHPKVS